MSDSDSVESVNSSDSPAAGDRSKAKRWTLSPPSDKSPIDKIAHDDSFDFRNPESDKENTQPSFLLTFEPPSASSLFIV